MLGGEPASIEDEAPASVNLLGSPVRGLACQREGRMEDYQQEHHVSNHKR